MVLTDQWIDGFAGRYPISDLKHIGMARGGYDMRTRVKMVAAPVLSVGLLLLLNSVLPVVLSVALGGVLLFVSVVTAFVLSRRHPRSLELVAEYHGRSVLLHSTTDAYEMAKLRRALIRALEEGSPLQTGIDHDSDA